MILMKLVLLFLLCTTHYVQNKKINKSKIVLERITFSDVDSEYLDVNVRVDKINKTSYAMNMNFTFLKDPPELNMDIQVFALYSNEYRKMPITYSRKLCDSFNFELKWVNPFDSNFEFKCPMKKGRYYIRNYIPDVSKLPFDLPWESVKSTSVYTAIKTGKIFGKVNIYARFDKTLGMISSMH